MKREEQARMLKEVAAGIAQVIVVRGLTPEPFEAEVLQAMIDTGSYASAGRVLSGNARIESGLAADKARQVFLKLAKAAGVVVPMQERVRKPKPSAKVSWPQRVLDIIWPWRKR